MNSRLFDFELLCRKLGTLWLGEQEIFDQAAYIYENLRQRGMLIEDADLLIAALSIAYEMTLVTNDVHLRRVTGLKIDNWLAN